MSIGTVGIWNGARHGTGAVAEIEALGFGALWLGGSPAVDDARPFLEAATTLPIATGILNIWQHDASDVAAHTAVLHAEFGERFLLGVGVGHPEAESDYTRPLRAMRTFLDGLDASPTPVPRDRLVLAALGPKMLDLAAERTSGTHPYFTTPGHTHFARERSGAGALVAPELAVVLESDTATARAIARDYAKLYLGLRNYTQNLLDFGFTDADVADGGSDRLIDAVIPHGDAAAIAAAVHEHLEAGADHVCLQPLGHGGTPVEDYRALAEALL